MTLTNSCSQAILSNTLTPTDQLITGHLGYSDDDIRVVLDDEDSTRPFPVDLVVIVRHITEVRVQATSQTKSISALQHRMQHLFQEINAFDPVSWAEEVEFFSGDVTPAIGQIFQISTRLHAIVALPVSIVSPPLVSLLPSVANASGLGNVCDSVRISQRTKLLERLRDTWPSIHDKANMSWPLLVAGVASADGPAEDQEFVARCLDELWRDPLVDIAPLLGLEKMRRFWRSGNRGWEDCFDEPVPW